MRNKKAMAYGSFPAQKKLVEKYKALLRANGVAGEEYKWEIPGKDHWNLEAPVCVYAEEKGGLLLLAGYS